MWQIIAQWVVTAIIATALSPKPPKPDQPKPGKIGNKDVPIASPSASIPVVFGSRRLSGPNVVWYGDVFTWPIKKKGGKK